jgi:hypothetical protein
MSKQISNPRCGNPFAALADSCEEVHNPSEETIKVVKESTNKKKKRKHKKIAKDRCFGRWKNRLSQFFILPWHNIQLISRAAWDSILEAIGNREKATVLESTIQQLSARIEALESHKLVLQQVSQPSAAGFQMMNQSDSGSTAASVSSVSTGAMTVMEGVIEEDNLHKYKKMLAVGVPQPAVSQKMIKDGLDPVLLFPSRPIEAIAFQRHKKALGMTPAQKPSSDKSLAITVAAIEEVRVGLRKITEDSRSSKQSETPKLKQACKPAAFAISESTLQALRGGLKKPADRKMDVDHTPMQRSGLRDVTNTHSGQNRQQINSMKTPAMKATRKSPSTAKSDGEYLQLALLKKFENVSFSPCDQ